MTLIGEDAHEPEGPSPETSPVYACFAPDLDGAVHTIKVQKIFVRPFSIPGNLPADEDIREVHKRIELIPSVKFVVLINDFLGFVAFCSDVAALDSEDGKSQFYTFIKFLSRNEWKHLLRHHYMGQDSRTKAIERTRELLLEIPDCMSHADGAGKECLSYRQGVMERELKELTKAHESYITPFENQAAVLRLMLKDPLPSTLRQSIESAILLYDSGDPIMCNPRRDFTIIFLNGAIVGGSYNWEEFDEAALDLQGGSLWLEESLASSKTEDSHMSLSPNLRGHWWLNQDIKRPGDLIGASSQTYSFKLDSGCTSPLGRLEDIHTIDPHGTMLPIGTHYILHPGGGSNRVYYNVQMKIPPAAGDHGTITHYRNTTYNTGGPDQRRLSSLMPFQHTYLAKAPGPRMEIGNQKTRVVQAVPSRLGDA